MRQFTLLLATLLLLPACHRSGLEVDSSCPSFWDRDALAASVEEMLEESPMTESHREQARSELDRTRIVCFPSVEAPIEQCGREGLVGGCVVIKADPVLGDDPVAQNEIRLPVIDPVTHTEEDFCEAYAVVEATKIAGWAATGSPYVLGGDGYDAVDGWTSASLACVDHQR